MHELEFTGERVVPGKVDDELFLEHVSRYQFAARFAGGRQVLDFGCGSGYGAAVLRRAGARRVVGSDLSPAAVAYAADRFGGAGTRFCVADCEASPFPERGFDLVVSFELIEHLASYRRFLAEVRRILRPGGVFVLSTPNKRTYRAETGSPPNPFHVHEFTLEELSEELGGLFPAVRIYGQSRTEGVYFYRGGGGGDGDPTVRLAAGGAAPAPRPALDAAAYFIAVCGDRESAPATASDGDSFLIAETDGVRRRDLRILELQDELVGRTRWARQIEEESSRRGRRILELQGELEERTRWAKGLEAESEARVRRVLELQGELEERLRWATEVNKEREERGRRIVELQKELDLLAHSTRGLAGIEERQGRQLAEVETAVRAELAEVRAEVAEARAELARRRLRERELDETLRWHRDSLIGQQRELEGQGETLGAEGRRIDELQRGLERQRGAADRLGRETRAISRRIDRHQADLATWKPQALEIEVAANRARELVDLLWASRSWRVFTWARRLAAPLVGRLGTRRPAPRGDAAPDAPPVARTGAAAARRALVVDHRLPTPDQDAGSVRMIELIRLLQELGFEVTFLPANLYAMEPYCADLRALGVEVVVAPRATALTDYLAAHGDRFELAIVSRLHIARDSIDSVRALCPRAKLVFDTVDLQHLRLERQADLEGDPELLAEAARLRAEELGVAARADATLVVSDVERDLLLRERPELRVHRVSLIHGLAEVVPGFDGREGFFFVGGFEHPPNVDAVQWFVGEVMPEVRRALPNARFNVIGSKAPDAIHALERGDGVKVCGHVSDLRPYLMGCRLSVAPLRYGAGIKGKVTQSLAWGLPTVVTSVAAEGMGLTHGVDALIADDPGEFARSVVDLHRDRELWERLSSGGRRKIEERFSAGAAREALVELLDRLGLREAGAAAG